MKNLLIFFSIILSFSTLNASEVSEWFQEESNQFLEIINNSKGTDSERLEWFRTINIAGEKRNDQELRNAVYSGSWVTDT